MRDSILEVFCSSLVGRLEEEHSLEGHEVWEGALRSHVVEHLLEEGQAWE